MANLLCSQLEPCSRISDLKSKNKMLMAEMPLTLVLRCFMFGSILSVGWWYFGILCFPPILILTVKCHLAIMWFKINLTIAPDVGYWEKLSPALFLVIGKKKNLVSLMEKALATFFRCRDVKETNDLGHNFVLWYLNKFLVEFHSPPNWREPWNLIILPQRYQPAVADSAHIDQASLTWIEFNSVSVMINGFFMHHHPLISI